MDSKALLVSVGGSPKPLIHSIHQNQATFACFLVSTETRHLVEEILEQTPDLEDHHIVLVENPEDLTACYAGARDAVRYLLEQGYESGGSDVTVDFTGGTKCMSAALVLAAMVGGWRFSYVGGDIRTKDGVGVVESGSERVQSSLSPWDIYAIEELRLLRDFFNTCLFDSAAQVAEYLKKRDLSEGYIKLAKTMHVIAQAYAQWDRFDYKSALNQMKNAIPNNQRVDLIREETGIDIQPLAETVQQHLNLLKRYKDQTNGFQRFSMELVGDLFSNSRRRAEAGRYDDAVIRLYRVLEMAGQIAFEETFDCKTDDVDMEKLRARIPQHLHEKIAPEERGTTVFPLGKTFWHLNLAEHPLGQAYMDQKADMLNIQKARNYLMLIHQNQSVREKSYHSLRDILLAFLGDALKEDIEFPKLQWRI